MTPGQAHRRVLNAVRSGRLVREPCETCGKTPTHAHHEDYDRPLEVRWFCRLHHKQEHAADADRGLRGLRYRHGLSQQQVAAMANLSLGTLRKLERGIPAGNVETLMRLALVFGMTASELVAERERAAA